MKSFCTPMQQQQKLHEECEQLVQKQLEQMQTQLLKQENFEKLLTNQVAQERGTRIFSAERISNSNGLSISISKNTEPLKEIVIALLKDEKVLSGLLINTI